MDFDIKKIIARHRRTRPVATLGVYNPQETEWSGVAAGLIETDEKGRVKRFLEKRSNRRVKDNVYVNGGLLICSPAIFRFMARKPVLDFAKDVFSRILREKKCLMTFSGARYVLASDTVPAWKKTSRIFKQYGRRS